MGRIFNNSIAKLKKKEMKKVSQSRFYLTLPEIEYIIGDYLEKKGMEIPNSKIKLLVIDAIPLNSQPTSNYYKTASTLKLT